MSGADGAHMILSHDSDMTFGTGRREDEDEEQHWLCWILV